MARIFVARASCIRGDGRELRQYCRVKIAVVLQRLNDLPLADGFDEEL